MAKQLRIDLKTIDDIAVEYRKVYRLARREEMKLDRAKSLCWMLKQLSGMLKEYDHEKRLIALESKE